MTAGGDRPNVLLNGPESRVVECGGPKWDQIETAARDLRVGIVHAARPTVPSRWETKITARQREVSPRTQGDFFDRSGVRPWDFETAV